MHLLNWQVIVITSCVFEFGKLYLVWALFGFRFYRSACLIYDLFCCLSLCFFFILRVFLFCSNNLDYEVLHMDSNFEWYCTRHRTRNCDVMPSTVKHNSLSLIFDYFRFHGLPRCSNNVRHILSFACCQYLCHFPAFKSYVKPYVVCL